MDYSRTWEFFTWGLAAGVGFGLLMYLLGLQSGIGFRWFESMVR